MKFICLVYAEPDALSGLSPVEKSALDRDSLAYDQELEASGRFIAASALQSVRTARTVRVRAGKPLVTDGPFAETKEVLCGFIFIEAADADEALQIAQGIPMARHGTIEVRPELDFG
jgi:hypothetical protein